MQIPSTDVLRIRVLQKNEHFMNQSELEREGKFSSASIEKANAFVVSIEVLKNANALVIYIYIP